jgi:hypothetical protein
MRRDWRSFWNPIGDALRRGPFRTRWFRVVLAAAAVLLLVGIVLDRGLDEPIRRNVENRMNRSLVGYTARIGKLDFQLFGLAMEVENLVVVQSAHPDPPVLSLPRLRMSVYFTALLYGRLVADAVFDSPKVTANLVQLREENRDDVPFERRGWQDALEAIYPLKIDELQIRNGTLVYLDDSGGRPLHATRIEVVARNIRNVRSPDREYPSTFRASGALFDAGHAVIDGHADFMAKPHPGVKAKVDLETVQLDYFAPVLRRFDLEVRKGFLSAHGLLEYASAARIFDIESIVVSDASIDYIHGGAPNPLARHVAREIKKTARSAMNNPEVLFRVRHVVMENGTIGLVNRAARPEYRVYVTDADFVLENLSSRAEDGKALASLSGGFMGSGRVHGTSTFYPEGKNANFEMKLEIADTQLRSMNALLAAHGSFDVSAGVFSLYTDLRVQDGRIRGYVKPLFRDVDVYDTHQDRKKNIFRKAYEGLVGVFAKVLENRRDEVATVATIEGPAESPDSSTLEIIGGLIRNAFFDAILPGFEREVRKAEPVAYRAAKRTEKRASKRRSPS